MIDTSILVRLANASDAQHAIATQAVLELHQRGEVVHVIPQVLIELRRGRKRQRAMKRTAVTYGQLDKVLRSLGFSCRLTTLQAPARVYEDKVSGARIILPPFPESDRVLDYHLVLVRTTLDGFGIADHTVFAAESRKRPG